MMIQLKLTLQTWVLKSSFWPGRMHYGLYIYFFNDGGLENTLSFSICGNLQHMIPGLINEKNSIFHLYFALSASKFNQIFECR